MKSEKIYQAHYDKICRVQMLGLWLKVKRGMLRALLLGGFVGFGLYGLPTFALVAIAATLAAIRGTAELAALGQVPGDCWVHLGGWIASGIGWVLLHRRHEQVLGQALEVWEETGRRRRRRLEEGVLWDPVLLEAALTDLGAVRHAQIVLGSSLAASRLTMRSTDAALEDRGREIERELDERARCLGIDPR
jgi:hypothetical protein